MNKIIKLFSIVMILSIVLVSCKKEDPKPDSFTPKFEEKETIKVSPALKENTDSEAQIVFSSANAIKTNIEVYSSFFNIPEDAEYVNQKMAASNASGSWTWTYGSYTAVYSLTETSTQYQFNYEYSSNGTTFYTIEGWENIAQTAGHYEAGYAGYNSLIMDWNQTTNGYHITMDYTVNGASALRYDANYNNDGSGDVSLTNTADSFAYYSATWGSDGHGTVSYHDETTGTITATYTF